MNNINEYRANEYINGLIVNDGWFAFTKGLDDSECPYVDDPSSAEKWLHGYHKAAEYFRWKEHVVKRWENK